MSHLDALHGVKYMELDADLLRKAKDLGLDAEQMGDIIQRIHAAVVRGDTDAFQKSLVDMVDKKIIHPDQAAFFGRFTRRYSQTKFQEGVQKLMKEWDEKVWDKLKGSRERFHELKQKTDRTFDEDVEFRTLEDEAEQITRTMKIGLDISDEELRRLALKYELDPDVVEEMILWRHVSNSFSPKTPKSAVSKTAPSDEVVDKAVTYQKSLDSSKKFIDEESSKVETLEKELKVLTDNPDTVKDPFMKHTADELSGKIEESKTKISEAEATVQESEQGLGELTESLTKREEAVSDATEKAYTETDDQFERDWIDYILESSSEDEIREFNFNGAKKFVGQYYEALYGYKGALEEYIASPNPQTRNLVKVANERLDAIRSGAGWKLKSLDFIGTREGFEFTHTRKHVSGANDAKVTQLLRDLEDNHITTEMFDRQFAEIAQRELEAFEVIRKQGLAKTMFEELENTGRIADAGGPGVRTVDDVLDQVKAVQGLFDPPLSP